MTPIKSLLAVGALIGAALAGCAPYPKASWTPTEAPVENQVRWIESNHLVRFTQGDASLSPGERDRLDAFLSLARPEYPDRVLILADDGQVDARRAASVREHLVARHVPNRQIEAAMALDDAPNTVKIVVGRYIVIPPSCPNWSKPPGPDANNRPGSNFGCATATNLGSMVVDPGDLVTGRAQGPGDATVSAGSVQRYRADKIKELPETSSRNTQAQ